MTREADPTRHLQQPGFPEVSLAEYLPNGSTRLAADTASTAKPTTMAALQDALTRLEETIDQESDALAAHQTIDIQEFSRRKSRSLLEVTRLQRTLPAQWESSLRDSLKRLHRKLTNNRETLELHLTAAKEISYLMASALSEVESDGTYEMEPLRRRPAA